MHPVSEELQSDLNSLAARGPRSVLDNLNAALTTGWSLQAYSETVSDAEDAVYVTAFYKSREVATLARVPEPDEPDAGWAFHPETADPVLGAKVLALMGRAVRQALVMEDNRVAHINRLAAETRTFADTLGAEDPQDPPESLGLRLHGVDATLSEMDAPVPLITLSESLSAKFTPSFIGGQDIIRVDLLHAQGADPVACVSAFPDGNLMIGSCNGLTNAEIRKVVAHAVDRMEAEIAAIKPVSTEAHISTGLDAGLGI